MRAGYGAALGNVRRRLQAWEVGASPQARSVRIGPSDDVHTRSSRECHSGAGVRWRHGWSTASVGRHGKIERTHRYGATLEIANRWCRTPGTRASPQACSVRCGVIDGGHAHSYGGGHSRASVRWSHGWSIASLARHSKIERSCPYGVTIGTENSRCSAREAGDSPHARSVRCGPSDGGHTRFSCDCHSSASVRWRHGGSTANVGRHGNIERACRYGAMLSSASRRR